MPNRFWDYRPARNQRLPREAYEVAGRPAFFTIRCARQRAPFASSAMARIAVGCLLEQRSKSRCNLLVYCVMPDHIHLLVAPLADGASSLQYVDRFKGWCGRLMRQAGWQSEIWQPRSYNHVLSGDEDVQTVSSYILHNPVRKGLCASPEEYPWSGIPEPLVLDESSIRSKITR